MSWCWPKGTWTLGTRLLSCETPLPILETKLHFPLFRGNSLRQLGAKNLSMSATPVSSANVSPKTPAKAYRLKVSKCCLLCNVNLTASSSFYRTNYAGLSEKLEKLLWTSIEPRGTVCLQDLFQKSRIAYKETECVGFIGLWVSGKIFLNRWQWYSEAAVKEKSSTPYQEGKADYDRRAAAQSISSYLGSSAVFNIAFEREWKKKKLLQHVVFVVGHLSRCERRRTGLEFKPDLSPTSSCPSYE